MAKTRISWTDAVWNPVRGCARVSEGCRNCYAERTAARFSGTGMPYDGLVRRASDGPRWTGEAREIPGQLADPISWREPRRIFVNSMSDLFHEDVSDTFIAAVFGVMAACRRHTFQILTKRIDRALVWFSAMARDASPVSTCLSAAHQATASARINREDLRSTWPDLDAWPLPNVWLGVSCEDQDTANARIGKLLKTPAAIRFLSLEPLLYAIDLEQVVTKIGARSYETGSCLEGDDGFGLNAAREKIDWVIAGCESGPGSRPCNTDWLRSIRDQCSRAGTPFFLKQARSIDGFEDDPAITTGPGSHVKLGGVVELPYLDGAQHDAVPEPA